MGMLPRSRQPHKACNQGQGNPRGQRACSEGHHGQAAEAGIGPRGLTSRRHGAMRFFEGGFEGGGEGQIELT